MKRRAAVGAAFGLILAIGSMISPSRPQEVASDAVTVVTVSDFAPLYCFPMDMNDGNIFWTHTATISGRNNYRYEVNEPQPARTGTTSCAANPKFVPGAFSDDFKVCTYAGAAAVVGTVVPGVGTMGSIFYFATTCGIAFLV